MSEQSRYEILLEAAHEARRCDQSLDYLRGEVARLQKRVDELASQTMMLQPRGMKAALDGMEFICENEGLMEDKWRESLNVYRANTLEPDTPRMAAWKEMHRGNHWAEHRDYPKADWAHEVAEDNTRQSYYQWVINRLYQEEDVL